MNRLTKYPCKYCGNFPRLKRANPIYEQRNGGRFYYLSCPHCAACYSLSQEPMVALVLWNNCNLTKIKKIKEVINYATGR